MEEISKMAPERCAKPEEFGEVQWVSPFTAKEYVA